MKNFLSILMPALALLTLGGCAGTSAVSTTENDGVYYSSKDRTTQNATASVASTAPADVVETESDGEISNPDYTTEGKRSSTVTESTEYYDDDYAYSSRIRRFHQPYYRGFGYGYNDFVFADPFWYGGPSYYGNAFYDPFYGPAYGGFGASYVNINIGFGRPWGWGYNPWRYGRGFGYGGFYDNYYGGYGFGGLGGYGFNNYYNVNNYYGGGVGTVRNVRYGPRTSRGIEAGTAGRNNTNPGTVTGSRGRVSEGGVANPLGGRPAGGVADNGTAPQPTSRSRSRVRDADASGVASPAGTTTGTTGTGRAATERLGGRVRESEELTNQQLERNNSVVDQINNGGNAPQPSVYEGRSRRRVAESVGAETETSSQPQYSQPRRSRFSELNTNQSNDGQAAEQPVRRQRTYEAPQRTYETPQRTYEAPQRTYEQPSRSYEAPQRSYSEPSRSSSPSDGGGNSGGARGRGRN